MKNKYLFSWVIFTLIILVSFTLILNRGVNINSNIMDLLPGNKMAEGWQQPLSVFEKRMNNNFLFIVLAKNEVSAKKSSVFLNKKLEESNLFKNINFKINDNQVESFYKKYYSHRAKLLTQKQKNIFASGNQNIWVNQVISEVYSPFGSLAAANLKGDPLGLFRGFLNGFGLSSDLESSDGFLISDYKEEKAVFLSAKINDGVNKFADKSLSLVNNLKLEMNKDFKVKLLATSPTLYFAEGSSRSMNESGVLSIITLLLITVIFLYFFNSFQAFLISVLTILFSGLSGFVVTHFVFSEVHIMSILLSISLLGIVADYCIHYFSHLSVKKDGNSVVGEIIKPMFYGLVTSVIGYLLLFASNLSILKQMSIFATVGLCTGFITVVIVLPKLTNIIIKPRERGVFKLNQLVEIKRPLFVLLGLFVITLSSIVLGSLKFDDDVKKLQSPSEILKSDEISIKEVLSYNSKGDFYLVKGDSLSSLLNAEELLLKNTGLRSSAISNYIPSLNSQEESLKIYNQLKPLVSSLYKKLNINYDYILPKDMSIVDPHTFISQLDNSPVKNLWLGKCVRIIIIYGSKTQKLSV